MKTQPFLLKNEFIRLDDLLKLTGEAQTGGQAKLLIQSGKILVNGEPCTMRGKKLHGGETVTIPETESEITVACP